MKVKLILLGIVILALVLRFYRLGVPVFKEDEFTTVKAAAYIFHCWVDWQQCRVQPADIKSKTLALLTANETVPSLAAEVYLWDFIGDKASKIHHSRAWPQLYLVAGIYRWLGISEFSSRLISVLAGSALIVAGYWFSRVLGSSEKLSWWFSSLLALAFPLIDFSRNARMYSLYILVFMILAGSIYRQRYWVGSIFLVLAYWLQMLTLIFPLALLIWSGLSRRFRLSASLLTGLTIAVGLSWYFKADFFGRPLLTYAWPPRWDYLNWWWLGSMVILWFKREHYLLTVIGVYLAVLVFFSKPDIAGAYTVALWPLALWSWLNWRRWLAIIVSLVVVGQFILGINYLYFGRDGRAQIKTAYQAISENYQPGDKIYAV